jgi:hypothetical protein
VVAGGFVAGLFMASPAAADVDCADLKTRAAAQAYYEGRVGDLDRLDVDADGLACEGNNPATPGGWTLVGLGVLMLAALSRAAAAGHRDARKGVAAPEPVVHVVPQQVLVVSQAVDGFAAPAAPRQRLVAVASAGSIGELARGLRMVQYADRMSLLEDYAKAHGRAPQDVLDDLAGSIRDLELQGWALAGYDPPWSVRLMRCDCVGGLRNFRLRTAPDGTRFWACASCDASVRHPS